MLLLFSWFFPQVIRLARCGHRGLGGARMVDGSLVAFPAALVSLSCLLLPLLVKPLRCCSIALSCCPPLLVLVIVMLILFFVVVPAGDSTGSWSPSRSGRSPHAGCQRCAQGISGVELWLVCPAQSERLTLGDCFTQQMTTAIGTMMTIMENLCSALLCAALLRSLRPPVF